MRLLGPTPACTKDCYGDLLISDPAAASLPRLPASLFAAVFRRIHSARHSDNSESFRVALSWSRSVRLVARVQPAFDWTFPASVCRASFLWQSQRRVV